MQNFPIKYKLLLPVLSLLLISSIKSSREPSEYENIDFDGNLPINKTVTTTKSTSFLFYVKFSSSQQKDYSKIYLTNPSENRTYVISVFSDKTMKKTIQMSQNIFGTPFLWLKKNQTKDNTLPIEVGCDTPPCSITLNIESEEKAKLAYGEQINYFVTEENEVMDFSFTVEKINTDLSMNIWASGGLNIETKLENVNSFKQYSKKNYYIFRPDQESADTYTLTVKGTPGDYINIGSLFFYKERAIRILTVDEDPITIFLAKNYLEKACFNMMTKSNYLDNEQELIFGTGIIDSNVVYGYFVDGEGKMISLTNETFTDGTIKMLTVSNEISGKSVCFTFPEAEDYKDIDEIVLTFQLNLGFTMNKGANVFAPQVNGRVYTRYLKKGNQMAFIGQFPGSNYNEINFNMISIKGFPKMTVVECEGYPLCLKTGEVKNVAEPYNINKFTTYSIYKNELSGEYSPVNSTQKVLMVECLDSEEAQYGDKSYDDICEFKTLIYSDINPIYLVENQYFNQYLLSSEKDTFRIDLLNQRNILQIYVDINVFSGQLFTFVDKLDGNDYKVYNNANKIYFVVTLAKKINKEITFDLIGIKNSFYSIQYSYVREGDDSSKKNFLSSGFSQVITVNPKKEGETQKIVSFENTRKNDQLPFIVNFYSLNCKLQIKANRKKSDYESEYVNLETFDYFTQDIYTVEESSRSYYSSSYDYSIVVVEEDFTDYNNKRCMLFASGVELTKEGDSFGREMVIGENTEQQVMFKKSFFQVAYLYPCTEPDDDIYIRFNLIDKAKYTVRVFYEKQLAEEFVVLYNQVIHLDKKKRQEICKEKDEVCSVVFIVSLDKRTNEIEPILEMELKLSDSDSVSYLQKNNMKIDFTKNNSTRFYYAEIGSYEDCSIMVNFHRGRAKLYAKLAEINGAEIYGGYKQRYKFPMRAQDSLPYDSFTQKIHFKTEDKCQQGCYLLITVLSDIETQIPLERNYVFSITIDSELVSNYNIKIPSVSIPTEEFVIGSIKSKDKEQRQFYEVWISKDSDNVVIDFQTESAVLGVNVGESKPVPEYSLHDFIFYPSGNGNLFSISKQEIIKAAKRKGYTLPSGENSLKDAILTLGVWANITDPFYTTIYSFLVHLDTQKELDIYQVNSDQKTLCVTTKNENDINYPYRCLYVIQPENYAKYNDLLIYALVQDNSVPYQIYADYIGIEDYELWKIDNIKSKIPTKESKFSTEKNKVDYLYLSKGLYNEYLFVSVVTKTNTTIELMTSFYAYEEKITPNPNSPQLFMVKIDTLELKFDDQDLYMIYLNSFDGEAEIYWKKEPSEIYYLRGRDDKLAISSIKGSHLIVKNLKQGSANEESPGFTFYVSYVAKNQENFAEISLGKSINFVFTHSSFPLILYTRLPDLNKNINVFFSLYDISDESNKSLNEKIYDVSGGVIKQSTLFSMIDNPDITIDNKAMLHGIYDPGVRTGFLRLTTNILKNTTVTENNNPNLYLMISEMPDMNQRNKIQKFAKISLEITAVQENSYISTTEKVYQYGSISHNDTSVYKLRPNILKTKMRIEFSATTSRITFDINTSPDGNGNKLIYDQKELNGRKIIDFEAEPKVNDYIYLIIKKQETDQQRRRRRDSYVFKYINYEDKTLLKDYEVKNSEVKVNAQYDRDKINYNLTFNAVPNSNDFNVTYLIKFVGINRRPNQTERHEDYVPNETIALSEFRTDIVKEFKNLKSSDGIINLNIQIDIRNQRRPATFIEVYAEINDASVNEFISYKIAKCPRAPFPNGSDLKDPESNKSSNEVIVFIVIGCILVIFVCVIVVVAFYLIRKIKI